MSLFAGMNMSGSSSTNSNATAAATPPPAQQPTQPAPSGSQMPGLFAGMNFGSQQQQQPQTSQSTAAEPTQAPPATPPQAPKPALGSAFGIQIGAFSNPSPIQPQVSGPPQTAQPETGQKHTLALFQGLSQSTASQPQASVASGGYQSPLQDLNSSGASSQQPPAPQASAFGFMGAGGAPPAPPVQAKPVEDDPFESELGSYKDVNRPATETATPPAQTESQQPAQNLQDSQLQDASLGSSQNQDGNKNNESFEEIKKEQIANTSASSANQSQDQQQNKQAALPEFRINNRVVKPDEIAKATAEAQKKPQGKGFFKSAFNFVTGGMLSQSEKKQQYAPTIPATAAKQEQPEGKRIGGVTIITGSQGTGIVESDTQVEEAPSPIGNKSQTSIIAQADKEKSGSSFEQPNTLPEAQTSSFNFIGMSTTTKTQSSQPALEIPSYGDPSEPAQPAPTQTSTTTSNVLGAFFQTSQTSAPSTEPAKKEPESSSPFDFLNDSLPSQPPVQQSSSLPTDSNAQEQPKMVWGMAGFQSIGSESAVLSTPAASQQTAVAPPVQGSDRDLFSMLNQNISQTTTSQANQMPGSAFNFMQNQSSLSMSNKSEAGQQPSGKQEGLGGHLQGAASGADIEEFEELSESREIIEDRIFRLKLQMIDLTIHQQNLSSQQETLAADIKILEGQRYEASKNEASAAEREDYDEAEKLNLKIQSIKLLINAKESQKKKLDEDVISLESRKGDKYVELGQLVEKSRARLVEIRTTQQAEMNSYEETEQLAVDEKKKRLHYERIRITEDSEETRVQREQAEKMEQEIDEQVYEDTKDQHIEKHRLDNEIEELDQAIQALEQQLALKRKARETLVLEKNVYEKQIGLARSKYQTKINKQASLMEKIQRKEEKLGQDNEDYKRETQLLAEYEEHFKSKLAQFEQELDDIAQLEVYLNRTGEKISTTTNEKKSCMELQYSLKQEKHSLSVKLQNLEGAQDHRKEQIAAVETQIEDVNNQLQQIESRKLKVEAEKKKHAASRKFKEASACQTQLKQLQTERENYERFKAEYSTKKDALEEEASAKSIEITEMQARIEELTTQIEREQQKYLIYRMYDCSDMIRVLRPFCKDGGSSGAESGEQAVSVLMTNALSVKDAKEKRHHLEQEQIKMQKELLELELKYGPLEVNLPKDDDSLPQPVQKNDSAVEVEEAKVEQEREEEPPQAEEPSSADQAQSESLNMSGVKTWKADEAKEQTAPAVEPEPVAAPQEKPTMSASQLASALADLENKEAELETQIQEACDNDDFEKADELQQLIDTIGEQKVQLQTQLEQLKSLGTTQEVQEEDQAPKTEGEATAAANSSDEKAIDDQSALEEVKEDASQKLDQVEKPDEEQPQTAAEATAPVSSGFAFMTKAVEEKPASSVEPEAAAKPAPTSGFSFMTAAKPVAEPEIPSYGEPQAEADAASESQQTNSEPTTAASEEKAQEEPAQASSSSSMPGLFAGLSIQQQK